MRLFLSTRKGLLTYRLQNQQWKYEATHFLGIPVSLTYIDPRNDCWWVCLDHGHWGTKLHRSFDEGKNWEELEAPRFPEGQELRPGEKARVSYLWSLAHGGYDHPDRIYIGTDPGALFVSENGGSRFELVKGLWDHPSRIEHWRGGGRDEAGIHSIIVDPEDSDHLIVGISIAGVFESTDGGNSWAVLNEGLRADFLPDPFARYGHDPHLLLASGNQPEYLWQQNHCGIFRSVNGGKLWQDVSESDGPANFGFALAVDEKDPLKAWVVPAVSDALRVAVDQQLLVSHTKNGGKTWQQQRNGLPQEACFDITYRHCLAKKGNTLVFGTTTGNVFFTHNEGNKWELLTHTLPMVYALTLV